jgi:hypothetical protein
MADPTLPMNPVERSAQLAILRAFATQATEAVVFIGADGNVPGQILDQTDAETLAVQLFGHLLARTSNPPTY